MACFICGNGTANEKCISEWVYEIGCPSCGDFLVTDTARDAIQDWEKEKQWKQKAHIAAYLAHRKVHSRGPVIIVKETSSISEKVAYPQVSIQGILDWFPKTISGKLDGALQNLRACTNELGTPVFMIFKNDYPLMMAETPKEAFFLLSALCEKDYVKDPRAGTMPFHRWPSEDIDAFPGSGNIIILLTAKGLAHLDELERQNPKSNKAFVAMWFPKPEEAERKLLDDAYANGFSKAIKEAGYDPIRIDKEEFLGRIDDEIIANIRQSRFVVADFTGQRGGVYYEAGFGHGLGIPVIFTCSKEHVDSLHFDTRQYNHLVWTDPSDLREKLLNRIKATIA